MKKKTSLNSKKTLANISKKTKQVLDVKAQSRLKGGGIKIGSMQSGSG